MVWRFKSMIYCNLFKGFFNKEKKTIKKNKINFSHQLKLIYT